MIDEVRKIEKLILVIVDMLVTLFDEPFMLLYLLFRGSYTGSGIICQRHHLVKQFLLECFDFLHFVIDITLLFEQFVQLIGFGFDLIREFSAVKKLVPFVIER